MRVWLSWRVGREGPLASFVHIKDNNGMCPMQFPHRYLKNALGELVRGSAPDICKGHDELCALAACRVTGTRLVLHCPTRYASISGQYAPYASTSIDSCHTHASTEKITPYPNRHIRTL